MSRVAYVNGSYVPHRRAMVHVEDRGYQFADGVYEVVPVVAGGLLDEAPHLDRLDRSLRELRIAWPMRRRALQVVMREVVRRNGVHTGILYLQVTRGVAMRDHKFPAAARPSLVMTARHGRPPPRRLFDEGVGVVTMPDLRWGRCDIKSVSLLPNVLGKQQAVEAGAFEAWLVDGDGNVTEGTSTNAWIVTADDSLVTRDTGQAILNGVTRLAVLRIAKEVGLAFAERAFSVGEAQGAREAFLTSSTSMVLPVTRIDDRPVGDGRPGPVSVRLRSVYSGYMAEAPSIAALPALR